MIGYSSSGNFDKTDRFLVFLRSGKMFDSLNQYGRQGVDALRSATPIDSGLTASSWTYDIVRTRGTYSIVWSNTNTTTGVPVAVLIQYGHGTGTGGWVQGRDFINPVIRPLFDKIADKVWKEVKNG